MGVIRGGRVWGPYDRGCTETTVGGTWPWVRCKDCGEWMKPNGEHCKVQSFIDFLAETTAQDSKE